MKRDGPADHGSPEDAAFRAALDLVEHCTGVRPSTCPWRAFSDPLVREVLEVSWAAKDGGGALPAVIGTDPPAKLAQAIGVYRRALEGTRSQEERLQREERAAERRARDLARKHHG